MRANLLVAVTALAWALQVQAATGADDAASSKDPEDTPSLELLEFLGDWETSKGQWLDPVALKQMKLPDQERDDHEDKK